MATNGKQGLKQQRLKDAHNSKQAKLEHFKKDRLVQNLERFIEQHLESEGGQAPIEKWL